MEVEKEITSKQGSQLNDCVTAQGRLFSLAEDVKKGGIPAALRVC